MKCLNCLGSEARCRWPRRLEWLWLWLVMPVRCPRCIYSYYVFTMFGLPVVLAEWVKGWGPSDGAK